jgi:asparagine synthase (glutamine-hydrolysing)
MVAPGSAVFPKKLLDMTRMVRHRGPDDGGYVFFDSAHSSDPVFFRDAAGTRPADEIFAGANDTRLYCVGLGHRRLSIVDLSDAALQPMASADGRFWVVFNGEIYNHPEIRRELESLGHRFRTHSDTEVLLAAYGTWGKHCLARFNGMFSFILYDRVEHRIFAARDRFGVKPLYYWQSPEGVLAFASEIKQFTILPGWKAQVNGERVYDFLAWGLSDHTHETCFHDVFQVFPGHYLSFPVAEPFPPQASDPAGSGGERWYKLQPAAAPMSLDEAAEGLRERLKDAISLRLRSDVKVGANLSGGLDSSTIVCLIDELQQEGGGGEPFSCLSAHSGYPRFDESAYARAVIERIKVNPLFVETRLADLQQEIDGLVWHQDEPFSSTSIFAEWCIYREASKAGIKVMLGGQGADEQLAGYPEHVGHYYRGWLRKLDLASLLGDMSAAHGQRGTPWSAILLRLADALMPQTLRQPLRRMMGVSSSRPCWLEPRQLATEAHDPNETFGFRSASVQGASRVQLECTNLPMQLRWEDRDSMAHSVESRTPFLDYRLVEFLHGLPDEFRYFHGESKRILRHAMRGRVPDVVLDRRDKMGFVTPEVEWVRAEGANFFRDKISRAIQASGGIIRPDAARYFGEMIDGRRRYDHSLWRVVSFGMWLERFGIAA